MSLIIIADTPFIAAAVIDSLPDQLAYSLVGPKNVAYLRRSMRCREYVVHSLSLEENSKADFVRIVQRLQKVNSNIFLIPVDDANRIVNSTADRLGARTFPIPDSSAFETLNDKWQFHRHCSKLGVRVPRAIRLGNKADIDFQHVCTTVGLPFVLKPTNKSNSVGVQVINFEEDFRKQIQLNRNYDYFPLLAQSFIPGLDIDISALLNRGHIEKFAVQIRKKDTLYFVQSEELVKLTEIAVGELRYTGVIHIDARLDNRSGCIFLIEANPRFWGSLAEATAGGLNFVRAGIYIALGMESPDPTTLSDVTVPSPRRMLIEIATLKRSYLRMDPLERLRLLRGMRVYIRRALRLP